MPKLKLPPLPSARAFTPFLLGALVLQRTLELRHARRNEAWARAQGAQEYGREHYPLFFLLHGGWLLAMALEGTGALGGRRGRGAKRPIRVGALAALVLAQPLRYWVIATLGRQWNTRILIVPSAGRVTGGPFRLLPHPNYAVVALEMLAAPLTVRATRAAAAFSLLNAALLLGIRIPAENRALEAYNGNSAQ